MSSKQAVGTVIHDLRAAAGLTQTELADLIGKKQRTVSNWEKGENEPSTGDQWRLEKALGLQRGDISRQAGDLVGKHFTWSGCTPADLRVLPQLSTFSPAA